MPLSVYALPVLALIAGCQDLPSVSSSLADGSNPFGPIETSPNIILIVADDLGYGDLGSYGQKLIDTPHLDRMAAEGMRFTDFYAGSPVCAPSRCTLMTGLHTGHAQVRDNWEAGGWEENDPEGQLPLQPGTVTLGGSLQRAGYATACIGKWGLGGPASSGEPNAQGFDHFYGFLCQRQAHQYYPTHLWRDGVREDLEGNQWHNLTGKHYAPDLMAEDALAWVDAQARAQKPFFLSMTFTIPHLALQVPEDSLAPYLTRGWDDPAYDGKKGYLPHPHPRAAYAGMVSRMDRDIGRLLAKLQELGIDEDTLVLFTSDNGATYDIGGAHSEFFHSNGVLRGAKGRVYEGGIRVPMIARWPGHVPAGQVSEAIGAFWDLMPTLLEVAGAPPPTRTDGISLLPVLEGRWTGDPQRELYWEFPAYGSQQSLRRGRWVLIRRDLKKTDGTPELYDLRTDISQQHDVASEHPQLVADMLARMAEAHVPSSDFPLPGVDS